MSPARFNGVPLTRRPWGRGEGENPEPDRCGGGGGGVYSERQHSFGGAVTADDDPAVVYTRSNSLGTRFPRSSQNIKTIILLSYVLSRVHCARTYSNIMTCTYY